ncbi:MAG TPA: hypothetical protein VLL28_07935, partial [Hyphomicrobiaceae bacterium]|nr:hypothetical protein [Hyphomicrobiaceae bacterium]
MAATKKGPAALSREDIRKTLQSFGVSGETAGGFSDRQLGERVDVDSRATGGGVDDPTGERAPIHYDPGDDTTFGARFGQWDQTATGKSLPRDEEDVDSSIMVPGQRMIDPLGHRGVRGRAGYYETRGMAEGGSVLPANGPMPSREEIQSYLRATTQDYPKFGAGGIPINPAGVDAMIEHSPESQNIEDRRDEAPLSMSQFQALMGRYPSPYTRSRKSAAAGPSPAEAAVPPDVLIDQTRKYVAEQLAGVEDEHEKQDPLEAAIEGMGGLKARHSEGGADEGRLAGGGVVKSAMERMLQASRGQAPIRGLPQKPLEVGGEKFIPGPSADVREAAEQYMREKGLPYTPLQNYVPVDEPRARAIARAYEAMPHRPTDAEVQRSYEALAKETRDQYELLNRSGAKFEPVPRDVPDPYGATPRLAQKDFLENKHMYYFPTEAGFGSEASGAVAKEGQKMLEPSGVKIAGKEVPFNDLFRVVHDVFGHHKEGLGFRAAGEENAWRSHGRMYSPEALPAMTSETRGQNSWVNYGPYAKQNKGASAADTVYAPQKLGILPPWTIRSGRMTPLGVAGAAAALEERDRERAEDPDQFRFADGGGINESSEPPLPDAVMDSWGDPFERAALQTKRGVLGAETMQGRGRPGDKFVEDPGQKEEAAKRVFDFAVPQSPLDFGLMAMGGPFRWPIKAGALALGAAMEPSEAEAGKLGAARKIAGK